MASSVDMNGLRETVATACRMLAAQGLVDYLGHVSVRIPGSDHFILSPRGNELPGLYALTAEDMLIVDLDGKRVEGTNPVPSEVFIHSEVLRARPDCQSVVHTHQRMAVAFALAGRPILPAHNVGSELFERPMPVYDSASLIRTAEQGRDVAAALGDHDLLHLRGHGIVATGPSVERATIAAIHLEQQAWHNYLALQLGGIKPMSADELREYTGFLGDPRGRNAVAGPWLYYSSLLEKESSEPS